MSQILSWERVDPKVLGHFFKTVVQAVLLFGTEMWVLTPRMERALSSFQQRVARRITGRQLRRRWIGSLDYPPLVVAMSEAGFEEIRTYVTRRQNTVAQYITKRPILKLCERSDWMPGAWLYQRWWEHDRFYFEGAKYKVAAESEGEEAKIEEEGLAQK